jgi:small subunit ribosomal protein S17
MPKDKQEKKIEREKKIDKEVKISECKDKKCPFHGELSLRGRIFRGNVIKKFPKRIVIEFERTIYIRKYERYLKAKTKLHAHLPDCLAGEINLGDYVEIQECRPLSKIISFVVTKKIRSSDNENIKNNAEGEEKNESNKRESN